MFRCKACGHIVHGDDAGECEHPHACPACGAGVSYNPQTGVKIFNAENWEVLVPREGTSAVDGKQISVSSENTLGITQQ